MLIAQNLSFSDDAHPPLSPLNVSVGAGELVKIVGENGGGKTTLLRLLCSLLPLADDATLRWCDKDVQPDADAYREELLYIGHQNGIADDLTPLENLQASAALRERPPRQSLAQALAEAGLATQDNRLCRTLSAGQKRRAALARLRAFQARLWVLDEPLATLDDGGRRMMEDWTAAHLQSGGMVVVSMHHPEDWNVAAARVVSCSSATQQRAA